MEISKCQLKTEKDMLIGLTLSAKNVIIIYNWVFIEKYEMEV